LNERQDHHVRVGIQKNIFDELIGAEAAQIRAPALAAERAGRLWRAFEGVGGRWAHPGAGRVDELALDVEDELVLASDRCLSERRLERGLLRDAEEAAAPAGRRVGGVGGEPASRGASSTRRNAWSARMRVKSFTPPLPSVLPTTAT
jgi:hypothetical protein